MLLIIPIRTETVTRKSPTVNYLFIGLNIITFLLFHNPVASGSLLPFDETIFTFQSNNPQIYQFFTYQFLHADGLHLLGNLLFLWVFGNSVNTKLGNIPYIMFYLSGGVFAAWGYATLQTDTFSLIGASGSIASVTTAYLVLFPRSRVTVLIWLFIFIHFVEVPAMVLIVVKIVLWDNFLMPYLGGSQEVAHGAHLAGYFYGFTAALILLLLRAVPRDQFDILALWKRWNQRRAFASVMSDPHAAAQAKYGSVAQTVKVDSTEQAAQEKHLDEISDLRMTINNFLENADLSSATQHYEKLIAKDPIQCLSEKNQIAVAREFYRTNKFPQAAAAFDRFVECYPRSTDTMDIRLLLGIIYARDLHQFEVADKHLTESMESLRDEKRRNQCIEWLKNVREALGRPAPE